MSRSLPSVILAAAAAGFCIAGPLVSRANEQYQQPPQAVIDILDAPPTPMVLVAPTRTAMCLAEYEAYPPIELLARPFLKLAGVRVDPARHSRQRIRQYAGLAIVDLRDGARRPVALPANARVQLPVWSYDGRWLAFARDLDDGVELWVADAATGEARALATPRLNDVLGTPIGWTSDNRHLLVRLVPQGRGPAPVAPRVPVGPHVQETAGKQSRMATFRDLLEDAHDEDLFEFFATSQLALVDVRDRKRDRARLPRVVHQRRLLARRAVPPGESPPAALLLPGALLLLHPHHRGVARRRIPGRGGRESAGLRRSPAAGCAHGAAQRRMAATGSRDAGVGRSARWWRPARQSAAS